MIPRVRSGVKLRKEDFGALIFTNRTPILALNCDALAIWEMFDGCRTVREISQTLGEGRGDQAAVCISVSSFVAACQELGLVELDGLES